MGHRSRTSRIALCGVLGALSVAILSMGSLIPLATYCAPMLAGIALIPVLAECPERYAWMTWAAAALLGLLLVPDRELALVYALVLGPYPMLKRRIDRLRGAPVRFVCRLAVFNLTVFLCYGLLLVVFPPPGRDGGIHRRRHRADGSNAAHRQPGIFCVRCSTARDGGGLPPPAAPAASLSALNREGAPWDGMPGNYC